ncbi:hypothetical protein [Lentzea sp. HUAS12]|uniref:hypothetical protein n=1 Tax=Lentzea sp. HUAS12 TaxID=2951806 RepID=UPI00209DC4EE|nr:hypothetical protein [Lentzea sp. HUAS12]USX53374.1 hypothetical protein ND450_04545 [Lentzea sp. HUAS12]
MYDKVIGLALFLAATAFPLALDEPAAPHGSSQTIAAAHQQDPGPGGEGPNRR